MHRPRTVGLLTVVAIAAPVPGALAATPVRWHNVVSPSKNVRCYQVQLQYGGPAIECMVPGLPRHGILDGAPYISLSPHGRSRTSVRSDYPGYPNRFRTLRYGRTWWTGKGGKIRCVMRTTGLTCRNLDGHGFRAAANATRRF